MMRQPSETTNKGISVRGTSVDAAIADAYRHERRIDFDLHGVVGIRLVDAPPEAIAAVSEQLGALQRPLLREPDISLRFVRHLPAPRFQHLGLKQMGFTSDAFFVFEQGGTGAKARIPFDQLGGECEIVCESGLRSVPLLMPIIELTALAKGFAAVHASAFVHRGVGVLIAGWAESGKTTALLGFALRGAEFVGDEWVLVSKDGQKMCGLPTMIELSPTHIDALPYLRHAIKRSKRWQFDSLRGICKMRDRIRGEKISRTVTGQVLSRALTALTRRAVPRVAPQAIFGDRVGSAAAQLQKVFLLISHDDSHFQIEPTAPFEMARRMAHLAHHEQNSFMEHYLAFKFAFPDAINAFIEHSSDHRQEILSRALMGKETYTVWHPHPLVFSELYEKIQVFLN